MKCELWYSVVVRDRHGKIVSRERRKSKSFLKQWNQVVYSHMAYTRPDMTCTDGVVRVCGYSQFCFQMAAAAGVTYYGIRVGTGNTAVAIDDYALETAIVEGLGPGQMEHLVCTVTTSAVAAPSCSFLVSRAAVNNSPGIITVREAAIYMRMYTSYYGCAVRDVFVTPQAVPIGGAITIDWYIQVTA